MINVKINTLFVSAITALFSGNIAFAQAAIFIHDNGLSLLSCGMITAAVMAIPVGVFFCLASQRLDDSSDKLIGEK